MCPLVPCLLAKLVDGGTLPGAEILSFIADVLSKLMLVHCSSGCASFATVVLDYLSFWPPEDPTSDELLYVSNLCGDWIADRGSKFAAVGSLLSRKKQMTQESKSSGPSGHLMFLSTLVKALHSELGSYPLDCVVPALSDTQLCAVLESSFEAVLAPENPALFFSVKAVQVLLSRLHNHWKSTGLKKSQIAVISLLFNLLLRAIKKLSECETGIDRNLSLADNENNLCTLLELLVDKQLVEEMFLSDVWLVQLGQGLCSDDQQKENIRRKSSGASVIETFVDYLCSSNIGEMLHTAVESCSKFSRSCVFKLAVSRLLSGSRVVIGVLQHSGAIGELLSRLFQLLRPAIDQTELMSFVESLLTPAAIEVSHSEILADILQVLLIPQAVSESILSFVEDTEDNDKSCYFSSFYAGLSDCAINGLLTLTCSHSSEKLDSIAFCLLNCKLQQEGRNLQFPHGESTETFHSKDGLISGMHQVARTLLSIDVASPAGPSTGNDVVASPSAALAVPGGSHPATDKAKQDSLEKIFQDLEKSYLPSSRASKLLGISLYSKLQRGRSRKHTVLSSSLRFGHALSISESQGKVLLDHAVTNLSPACVKVAGLLMKRSRLLLEYFMSRCIPKLCKEPLCNLELGYSKEDNRGVRQIHSYFYLFAQFFKALSEIYCNENSQKLSDVLKGSLKLVQKTLVGRCLQMSVAIENMAALNVMVVQVIEGICKNSSKGLKRISRGVKNLDSEPSVGDGPWNQCQVSIACCVALETLDPVLCGIAVKRSLQKLTELFGTGSSKKEDRLVGDVTKLLQAIQSEGMSLEVQLENLNLNDFIQATVRVRFGSGHLLRLVALLIAVFPLEDIGGGDVKVDLEELYKLVWMHSEFLTVMSIQKEDEKKERLVELLVAVVERQPKVCQASHIGTLLSAYSATRSITDRGLLYLLYKYEASGVPTSAYRPYLWGAAAVEQYQQKQEVGWLLWKQPGMQEVMELLDRKHLFQSAANFPINVELEPVNPFSNDHLGTGPSSDYNPCFILPLLSHLLDPGNVVDCRQFVDYGCLSYLMMALSSQCEEVRAAAGHALTRFSSHLEASRFREKAQIVLLLKVLKNTIAKPVVRINSALVSFCARSAHLFLDPDDPLYPVVGHFIVYKPALDINEIPLFNVLLHSSSIQHKAERRWLLNVLVDGLKCEEDFVLYRKRRVIQQAVFLYNSGMLDSASEVLVARLVQRVACLSNAARELLFSGGLCFTLC